MARILIDTNVVLSHLLERDDRQRAQARELFGTGAQQENDLIVHQIVVTETVYVLARAYRLAVDEIGAIIRDLLESPGVVPLNDLAWTSMLALWPGETADFTDACLASAVKTSRIDAVATFDVAFAKQLRRLDLPTYWD